MTRAEVLAPGTKDRLSWGCTVWCSETDWGKAYRRECLGQRFAQLGQHILHRLWQQLHRLPSSRADLQAATCIANAAYRALTALLSVHVVSRLGVYLRQSAPCDVLSVAVQGWQAAALAGVLDIWEFTTPVERLRRLRC